ncbi:MAG: virulence factor [Geminicoccaceae bacterium]
MARFRILYWHQIPSVVEVRDEQGVRKKELSARFQELIDRVAMRKKLVGTDAYLEGWHRGRAEQRDGNADEVAQSVVAELEASYETIAASVAEDQ